MSFRAVPILKMTHYAALLLLFLTGTVASAQPARSSRVSVRPPDRPPENFYVIKERKHAQFEALRKLRGERFLNDEEGTGYVAYRNGCATGSRWFSPTAP